MAGLSVGMYLRCPGNSDTFGKEILSLNVYTGAAWSGDFQLLESELVLGSQWVRAEPLVCCLLVLPETSMLRLLRSGCPWLEDVIAQMWREGVGVFHYIFCPFSAPVTCQHGLSVMSFIF